MHAHNPKILLAGGGTAGHVEPALAVGRWITQNVGSARIEFLGTAQGLESRLVPEAGFTLNAIAKAPFPRTLKPSALLWPWRFLRSILQTWRAMRGVDLLIGFGGYVCTAAYIVARLKKISIIVHEANAVPGWANKLGARLGATVLISFESSRGLGRSWKDAQLVGIPLRNEVLSIAALDHSAHAVLREQKAQQWGIDPDRPIVLVFGGSQGSQHMNKVIAESINLIVSHGIQVVHAVGRANPLPKGSANYKPVPYFEDLPQAYCAADLIICRSGAVTCHELMAIGSYALLVPLAIGNGEQRLNGSALVESGAASMVENSNFTTEWLSNNLLGLITAGKKFNATPHVPQVPLDAVNKIGRLITDVLERKG
jgi:UDP-N-acetylglucosamine--N-acetylmuramyl-(pentapeptide) pyrophosphoryl-undecaprenol N-acetylglucosamine transferase